jgi:hypothetical protein
VGQQEENRPEAADASLAPGVVNSLDTDYFQLTSGERLVIRNYRAMKKSTQQTFEDISEELALAFPASRPPTTLAPAKGH